MPQLTQQHLTIQKLLLDWMTKIRIDHILGFDARDLVKRQMRIEEKREAARAAVVAE